MRPAGDAIANYDLSITIHLPKRDARMKSKNNTHRLAIVLSTFSVGEDVTFETADDGV